MMTNDMFLKLKRSLIKHEGFKTHPYEDTIGKITIGIGYNLTDRGLPADFLTKQFQDDINYFHSELSKYLWFQICNVDRQIALIDMCFNLGLKNFLQFNDMISALKKRDYKLASEAMLKSKWAKQVGKRAIELANGMLQGMYNV